MYLPELTVRAHHIGPNPAAPTTLRFDNGYNFLWIFLGTLSSSHPLRDSDTIR